MSRNLKPAPDAPGDAPFTPYLRLDLRAAMRSGAETVEHGPERHIRHERVPEQSGHRRG